MQDPPVMVDDPKGEPLCKERGASVVDPTQYVNQAAMRVGWVSQLY